MCGAAKVYEIEMHLAMIRRFEMRHGIRPGGRPTADLARHLGAWQAGRRRAGVLGTWLRPVARWLGRWWRSWPPATGRLGRA